MYFHIKFIVNKSKRGPRQAEMAQGVPGRVRPRIFLTFRHYKGGRSSAKRTGRLYPRRNPWYSLSEAEATSGHMVLSGVPRKISPVIPGGIDPGNVRLVAKCLNHYATPGSFTINAQDLFSWGWTVICHLLLTNISERDQQDAHFF